MDYHERHSLLYTFYACEATIKVSSENVRRTFAHFAIGNLGAACRRHCLRHRRQRTPSGTCALSRRGGR